jgi:hypothetical protein
VQPGERAGEDRQLFAGIVADHADLPADLRPLGVQRQRPGVDITQLLRVETIEAEIVHRIVVDRMEPHHLAVEEGRRGRHRARRHDMAVREDDPTFGIDDETRRFRRLVPVRVEGAVLIEFDRHDAAGDARERGSPGRVGFERRDLLRHVGGDGGLVRRLRARAHLCLPRGHAGDGGRRRHQHGQDQSTYGQSQQSHRAPSQAPFDKQSFARAAAGLRTLAPKARSTRVGPAGLCRSMAMSPDST